MVNLRFRIKKMTDQLIEWSEDNTAGLIMSRPMIWKLTYYLWNHRLIISDIDIDELMGDLESERGFLMKASDFKGLIEIEMNKYKIK
jgi:hypothetical protein